MHGRTCIAIAVDDLQTRDNAGEACWRGSDLSVTAAGVSTDAIRRGFVTRSRSNDRRPRRLTSSESVARAALVAEPTITSTGFESCTEFDDMR